MALLDELLVPSLNDMTSLEQLAPPTSVTSILPQHLHAHVSSPALPELIDVSPVPSPLCLTPLCLIPSTSQSDIPPPIAQHLDSSAYKKKLVIASPKAKLRSFKTRVSPPANKKAQRCVHLRIKIPAMKS